MYISAVPGSNGSQTDLDKSITCPLDTKSNLFKNSMSPDEYLLLEAPTDNYSEDDSIITDLQTVADGISASEFLNTSESLQRADIAVPIEVNSGGQNNIITGSESTMPNEIPAAPKSYVIVPALANDYGSISTQNIDNSSYSDPRCRLRCLVVGTPSCAKPVGGSRPVTLGIFFLLMGLGGFSIAACYSIVVRTNLCYLIFQIKIEYERN